MSADSRARTKTLTAHVVVVATAGFLIGGVAAAAPSNETGHAPPEGISMTTLNSQFSLSPGQQTTWPIRIDAPAGGWTSLEMRLSVVEGHSDPFVQSAVVHIQQCNAGSADQGTDRDFAADCTSAAATVLTPVLLQDLPPTTLALGHVADSVILLIEVELPINSVVENSEAQLRVDVMASDSRQFPVFDTGSGLAKTGGNLLSLFLLGTFAVAAGVFLAKVLGRTRSAAR